MALPVVLIPHPHVRVDRKILGGSPYVAGSRVPVRRLLGFYQGGTSVEKLLKRYPQLSAAKVLDALAFALDNPEVMEADMAREQDLLARREPRVQARGAPARQAELPFGAPSKADPDPER